MRLTHSDVAEIRLRCSKNTTDAWAFTQARWGVLSFIGNQNKICLRIAVQQLLY